MQKMTSIPKGIGDYANAAEVFQLIREELALVQEELEHDLQSNVQVVTRIGNYLLEAGGKRVRPSLLLLSARSVSPENLRPGTIELAAVIELIHTATLVHDDIIDDADTRRGRQSVNVRWGNEITVLAGDWLYMTAFQKTLAQRNFEILDILTNLTCKMTEGELLQLTHRGNIDITEEEHLDIVHAKTAYLFSAAAEIGAIIGGASPTEQAAMREYGLNVGIAFQLVDDLLDFTASEDKLGKPVASDLRDGKLTLPAIWLNHRGSDNDRENIRSVVAGGLKPTVSNEILESMQRMEILDQAHREAERYARLALDAAEKLRDSVYRDALIKIARFVVERDL
jgi:octaprenyl-diphosphate synthase